MTQDVPGVGRDALIFPDAARVEIHDHRTGGQGSPEHSAMSALLQRLEGSLTQWTALFAGFNNRLSRLEQNQNPSVRGRPVLGTMSARTAAVGTRESTDYRPLILTLILLIALILAAAFLLWIPKDRSVSQRSAATAGACKIVTIKRPSISASTTQISVRFRSENDTDNGMVVGLEECIRKDPADVVGSVRSPAGGTQVRLALRNQLAQISVPVTFVAGTADQVVCRIDPVTKKVSHVKYMMQWSQALPKVFALDQMASYDFATADVECAIRAPK